MEIRFAKSFYVQFDLLVMHFAPYYPANKAAENILKTINDFAEQVNSHPESCPLSPHLVSLGFNAYCEFNKGHIKIIYKINKQYIDVLLICSQKQDLEKLIVNYCLIK